MIDHIIDFPQGARVDRLIPKQKIYDKANVTNRVKSIFIAEIDQIRWLYKLSPETINIPATDSVQEIQVFHIRLRGKGKTADALLQIDKAIPSPILFILQLEARFRYVACYKRANLSDRAKWVISEYFSSDWISERREHQPLPLAINLETLYHHFLRGLIAIEMRDGENFSELIQRAEAIRVKEKEAERLQSRLQSEKQFNRKVTINAELRELKQKLEDLAQ